MKTSIQTTSGPPTFVTGSEGPSHDPYSYDETSFKGWTVHLGLVEWVQRGAHKKLYLPDVRAYFKAMTGYTPEELRAFHGKLRGRCRECGSKRFAWHAGYPGETIMQCLKCGKVSAECYDESAVI